jgi:hypothetical protein
MRPWVLLLLAGCTQYSALRHSPFAEGGSAHDADYAIHQYGAWGVDCKNGTQCPEGHACGSEVSIDNPWGNCKPGQCCPIAGFHDDEHGYTPKCGMLGCR